MLYRNPLKAEVKKIYRCLSATWVLGVKYSGGGGGGPPEPLALQGLVELSVKKKISGRIGV